jgi:uncharacterized protein (DUF1810 family)
VRSGGFDLERFVSAQASAYETAVAELRSGRKRSHWMWFIFPQLRGLGMSSTAHFYGLASLEEAQAYLAHPVLHRRLVDAVAAVDASGAASLRTLFGAPDDMKFRSSMTIFALADSTGPYRGALDRWCAGQPDPRTLELIAR